MILPGHFASFFGTTPLSLVAVKYRGWWFYVADADVSSRFTLTLFSDLFRLQRIGAAEGQPLLTLPVGR